MVRSLYVIGGTNPAHAIVSLPSSPQSDCQALGNDVAGRSEKVIVLQGGKDSNYQVFGARSANCKAIL